MYNLNYHNRYSIRLKEYNYAKSGMYFITICSHNREKIFGKIEDDIMNLSKYGLIAERTLQIIQKRLNKKILIPEYIIMPNHLHFIVQIKRDNIIKLKDLITTYKSIVTKNINKNEFIIVWQRNYYEHIIRNEKELFLIIKYIKNNPINWKQDSLNESKI